MLAENFTAIWNGAHWLQCLRDRRAVVVVLHLIRLLAQPIIIDACLFLNQRFLLLVVSVCPFRPKYHQFECKKAANDQTSSWPPYVLYFDVCSVCVFAACIASPCAQRVRHTNEVRWDLKTNCEIRSAIHTYFCRSKNRRRQSEQYSNFGFGWWVFVVAWLLRSEWMVLSGTW